MKGDPLLKIREFGQSVWLDFLSREIILAVPATQEGLKCINRSLRNSLQ